MTRLILCGLLLFSVLSSSAQKLYFVYLQTEGSQPFFVKLNERIQSSTGSGYLILSRLRDSTYTFSVGFPQNQYPEQRFSISINRRDHGYILKNFGEKGWGLFNLRDLSVQMGSAVSTNSSIQEQSEGKSVSAFTDILSKAADDPSLKEKPPPLPQEKKAEPAIIAVVNKEETRQEQKTEPPVKEVVKKEEPKTVQKSEDKPAVSETSVSVTNTFKPTSITRQSQSLTNEGFGMVFIDQYPDGSNDTIQIIIPQPKMLAVIKEEPVKNEPLKQEPVKEETKKEEIKKSEPVKEVTSKKKSKKDEPKKEEVRFIETEIKQPVNDNLPVKMRKNNCKGVATDSDFLKLRKKMAGEEDDDDMVDEARKYFKTTCFSTIQIKNLSALFLDDLGKYKFFDLAYLFVSDPENFHQLQSELKNEYYINRFRTMLQ